MRFFLKDLAKKKIGIREEGEKKMDRDKIVVKMALGLRAWMVQE